MMTGTDLNEVERRLWAAADELRANSSLTAAQYRDPVLGLIFLAFAEHRFDAVRPEVEAKATERRPVSADDFRAKGVVFVPEDARLSWLVERAEWEDVGRNVDLAMDSIEAINLDLAGVLPRGYQKLEKDTLIELIRLFAPLPRTLSGDAFGLIYEYFLTNFASSEGRLGGSPALHGRGIPRMGDSSFQTAAMDAPIVRYCNNEPGFAVTSCRAERSCSSARLRRPWPSGSPVCQTNSRGAITAAASTIACMSVAAISERTAADNLVPHRFRKGKSGNPNGRPKGVAARVRELAGGDPDRFLNVVIGIAEDPKARAADRLRACEMLLDRGWGKAPAFVPVEEADPLELDAINQFIDERQQELGRLRDQKASQARRT